MCSSCAKPDASAVEYVKSARVLHPIRAADIDLDPVSITYPVVIATTYPDPKCTCHHPGADCGCSCVDTVADPDPAAD